MGATEAFTFENRMFNAMIFLAFIMTFLGGIVDLIVIGIFTLWFAFSVMWLMFYYMSRFKNQFLLAAQISFAVLIFVFFPYGWLNSNGTIGVFPYYAIISVAYVNIILSGRTRIFMNVSMACVLFGLFRYDYYYSSYLDNALNHYGILDVGVHIIISMTAMAVLIMVYSNTYMKEKRRVEEFSEALQEQYQQQLYYMENLEALNQKLKSERHDFNHHLGVVYGLLEGQENNKAREYTHRLVDVAEEYQTIVHIPYPMIRTMLNFKLSMVVEKGIKLRLNVNLPEGLGLNEYDLTIILGNMIDNAMEACMLVEDDQRFIALNLYVKLNYIVVQVKNTAFFSETTHITTYKTTKKDSENHGFGLKNIEYLVNKHKGIMKIEKEKDQFMTYVALLISG